LGDEVKPMQPEIVAAWIGVAGVVLGVVLGSVISYRLGKRQSVDQDLRVRRIEATAAVRSKIKEISTGFESHSVLWENRDTLVWKVDDLADYYQSNKPWLREETRPIIEACIDDLRRFAEAISPTRDLPEIQEYIHMNTKNMANTLRNRLEVLDSRASASFLAHTARGGGGDLVPDSEQRERRQEFRDRSFEVQKHLATLSTAASLLILAVYRERHFEGYLLAATLILLAVSALLSIHGMTAIALDDRRPRRTYDPDPDTFDRYIYRVTGTASNILTAAVVVFALFLFGVPFWIGLTVPGVLLVLLLVGLWWRHRKAARTPETPTETRSWWRRVFGR
jgi:hypothetical protein